MAVTQRRGYAVLAAQNDAITTPLKLIGILIQSGATTGTITVTDGGSAAIISLTPTANQSLFFTFGYPVTFSGIKVTALPATCQVTVYFVD